MYFGMTFYSPKQLRSKIFGLHFSKISQYITTHIEHDLSSADSQEIHVSGTGSFNMVFTKAHH
jgi:hypothetical protein